MSVFYFSYSKDSPQIKIKVSDKKSKELLMGANIQWVNLPLSSTTDEHGEAIITLPDSLPATLTISYIGYQTDTIYVYKEENLNIQLRQEIQLQEVKISSRRLTNYISSMDPLKTEKIDNAEFKKAACCNLSESFQTNASVDVNYQDAVTGAKEIKLLGLSGMYVQNLLEGIPFLRGITATFGLDNIPAAWMKSIAISKGVPSVKNSYEGITGSMNVEFKSSINNDQKLYFDVFANQNGRIETNLLINHKINTKLGTMLMANGAFIPTKEDNNKDGFLDQPVMKQYNLLNRWNYHSEKVEGQYMLKVLSENRIAGQTSLHNHLSNDTLPLYGINISTKRVEGFAKTGYILNEESSLGSQLSGVYHQQQSSFGQRLFNTTQSTFTGNLLYQTTVKSDDHSITSGTNIIYDAITEGLDTLSFIKNDIAAGIFAEYTYKYKDKITLVAGIRGDYHTRAGFQINPRVHARFALTKTTTLRIAAGRGFRAPNVLTENQSLLASSRRIVWNEIPAKEVAWNYGLSILQKFKLVGRDGSLSVDFFRTDFTQQAIVDIDYSDNKATVYNLKGKSYSNSLLIELNIEVLKGLDVKAAYRLEDVRITYHGILLQKALQAMHKGLLALSYKTPNQKWQFDVNMSVNGRRRLPNSFDNDTGKRYSPVYVLLNAQILKYFKFGEIFIGTENISNYQQKQPIIGNPNTQYFDTYQVYAPIMGATIYGGFRIFIQ